MKKVKIFSGQKPGLVLPSSKSYLNRLLILGSLLKKEKPFVIHKHNNSSYSDDVKGLIECLIKIGIQIQETANDISIFNTLFDAETIKAETIFLNVGEGGTTLRFLLALLSRGKRRYHITGQGRLPHRPLNLLINHLRNFGADIKTLTSNSLPLEIQGPITNFPSIIDVNSHESSQFASALALALSDHPEIEIRYSNNSPSFNYFSLTQDLISLAQKNVCEFNVPIDMSSLTFLLSWATLCGDLTIYGISNLDPKQPDFEFINFIKQMGAQLNFSAQGLVVFKNQLLKAGTFSCKNCPDSIPPLVFLCSYAKGVSRLRGISHLRFKESNRIEEILLLLEKFYVKATYDPHQDMLTIIGPTEKTKIQPEIKSMDHRMVMMGMLFLSYNNGGNLGDINSLSKSFPHFLEVST